MACFTNAGSLLKSRTLVSGCMGYCYAHLGNKDEALRQLMLVDPSGDHRQSAFPVSAAAIWAALGDRERALAYLDDAVAARNTSVPVRTLNPEFNDLRNEPRFHEALRTMGIS